MSHVIAVVGAGGKSTLIENLADRYAAENKRVCITTTTHIFKQPDRENIFYIGTDEGEKFSYPGDYEFSRLCCEHDVILVEADGSRHFPIKIPASYEPVIPKNVSEIFVVMGMQAVGRPVSEVCHRYDKSRLPDEIVTRELIDYIAQKFYIEPLNKKFPCVPVNYVRNDFVSGRNLSGKRVALVLLASGSSRRFEGANKLFHEFRGKKLFHHGLDSLINAKMILNNYGIDSQVFVTGGNISECDGAEIINNPDRLEGISGSIRHGTQTAIDHKCDAVLFLAGDMPNFTAEDIARLVREFFCSGKLCGCAYSNHPANPGIFSASLYCELLNLSGDSGALRIIRQNQSQTHYYVTSPRKLFDIDTLNDTVNL